MLDSFVDQVEDGLDHNFMAEKELSTEEALRLLEGSSSLSSTPTVSTQSLQPSYGSSLLDVSSPYRRAAAVGAGGLLNLADALTFGLTGNVAAGGSAIASDLASFYTGQPSTTSFEQERAKLAELKAIARGEQIRQGYVVPESVPLVGGAPIVELAGALKAPIPKAALVGRGEALVPALARAVPVSAALGAAPALSVEVPAENIASLATLGGGIGGGVAGLLPVIGAGARAAAPLTKRTGEALVRTALGARKSDYTKTARNSIIESVQGDFQTQVQKSLNQVIENKTLGNSLDPNVMYGRLQDAKEGIENQIQSVLEKRTKAISNPSFDKTLKYISERVAADDVDRYLSQLERYSDALKREGKGQLTYLNTQKKIIGENWKNSPQSDPGFWRTLYREMKEHIEKYAPEVKDLNKQKQDLIVVEPIIERTKRATEGESIINNAMRQLYTTGGAGLVGGATLGGLVGEPEAGAIGAMGLRLLATPKGQQLAGRGLSRLSQALSGVGEQGGLITGIPSTVLRSSALAPALSGYGLPQDQMMTPLQQVSAPSSRELTTEEALALIQ